MNLEKLLITFEHLWDRYTISKFAKSFSFRSNRFANPTPKMAYAIFGSPAHHPEKDSKIVIKKVKDGIQRYTVEMKSRSSWNATAANGRFYESGAVTPQTILCVIARLSPVARAVKPRLHKAARTLPAMAGDISLYKRFSGLETDRQETLGEADSRKKWRRFLIKLK